MMIHLKNVLIPRAIRNLKKSDKGTVLIEFAFVFPVTLLLLLGGFETFRLLMAHRKANTTVMSVSNLFSQNKSLNTAAISDIFDSVEHVMKPLELKNDGQVLISYITGNSTGNSIDLQCKSNALSPIVSKIGTVGNKADLTKIPGNFTIVDTETVVVAEVVYRYEPVFVNLTKWFDNGIFTAHDVYHVSVQKPRYTAITFNGGCP